MFNSMLEAFVAYFIALLSISFYFYYKNRSQKNSTVVDRKLNYWLTAISAQASDMSDWLFMGFPGAIYATGCIEIWTAIGLLFFMFLNWHYIAPRFRVATESVDSVTLASFLQNKFQAKNNLIRIISGLLCLYFFVFYIAAGLAGLGRVFESAFNLNYYHGVILGFIITLSYALLGGLLAVAWSNLIQGIFLLIAILIVPCYAMYQLGGIDIVITTLQQQNLSYLSFIPEKGGLISILFASMAWGLGYFGQPHILINFMSLDNVANMKKAKYVGLIWQFLALSAAILVGFVGKSFIYPALENSEMVFISMVTTLFTPFFAGIILCAMLAATISTINTQSLVSAALITEDLYYQSIQQETSYTQKLEFKRLAIFIVPLLALITAFYNTDKIFNLVFYAWSGLGCSFGPLVILSLYTHFVTATGAISGLIVGGIIGIFWPIGNTIPTLIIGFILNMSITVIVSKLAK